MCLEAYSAVYYDDKDYIENWKQPASNGTILDSKQKSTHASDTGRHGHSSARFCFELSGNSNSTIPCNSNFDQNFELDITLD